MSFKPLPFFLESRKLSDHLIKSRLGIFHRHFSDVEAMYEKEMCDLWRHRENIAADSDRHVNELHHESHYNLETVDGDLSDIELVSVRLHRYSMVIQLQALVETFSKELHSSCFVASVNGFRDGDLILFLKNDLKMDVQEISGLNGELSKLKKIRNCIAHCDGRISKCRSQKEFQKIVKSTKGVYECDSILIVEKLYIDRSIKDVENFFEKIFHHVDIKKREI